MIGWGYSIDHYCSACERQLTHRPNEGQVKLVDNEKKMKPSTEMSEQGREVE